MSQYAVIKDGIVINKIIADSLEIAQEITQLTCVEFTPSEYFDIGWTYSNGGYSEPTIIEDSAIDLSNVDPVVPLS